MNEIAVNLVYEDPLSGAVLYRLLRHSHKKYAPGIAHSSGGIVWIRSRIQNFNRAARGMPYLVLTDLDVTECAPRLLQEWLPHGRHRNLLLRVAVREVEAWLLGCREALAKFLSVDPNLIPFDVDDIPDPKAFLVNLARRSRKKSVRQDIVPETGSTARVGPDYNGRLSQFVSEMWDPVAAGLASPSLSRTIRALDAFEPVIEEE